MYMIHVMPDCPCVPGQTKDVEEKEQCERLHELIREYKLEGQLRWLVAQKDRVANGELYRYIAGARPRCCTTRYVKACQRKAPQRQAACFSALDDCCCWCAPACQLVSSACFFVFSELAWFC